VLNYLEVDMNHREVNLGMNEHKQQWFMDINPNGQVPAIKDGEYCLAESATICRYIVESREMDTEVYPYKDIKKKFRVEQLIDYATDKFAYHSMDCVFQILVGPLFFNMQPAQGEDRERVLNNIHKQYKNCEEHLNRQGTKYFASDGNFG
jgi:glutathione S-transferase